MPREVLWISANVKALQERSPLAPPTPPFPPRLPLADETALGQHGSRTKGLFYRRLKWDTQCAEALDQFRRHSGSRDGTLYAEEPSHMVCSR